MDLNQQSPTQAQPLQQPNTEQKPQVEGYESLLAQPDAYDDNIKKNLEEHLNFLPVPQKSYLLEHLTPEAVNILGIVNGQEVFDYFADVYQQVYGNSAPQPGPESGQQPGQPASPQPQQQAMATPPGVMPSGPQ